MKRIILKALFVVFFIVLLTLLTLPKFLLLDKALSKGGLYLTAEKVEEGLTYISLKKVNLYDQSSRLVAFDSLRMFLSTSGVHILGVCEGGSIHLNWFFGIKRLKAQDFSCLKDVESLSAELSFTDGVFGKVQVKGLSLEGMKVESLSLDMRGRVFTARAKVMGFELLGDGQIVFNPSDPLRSKINGQLSGGGMSFSLSGTLERLQLRR